MQRLETSVHAPWEVRREDWIESVGEDGRMGSGYGAAACRCCCWVGGTLATGSLTTLVVFAVAVGTSPV